MDAKAFGLRTNIGYFFEAAAFSFRKLRPQRYVRRENANKFAFAFAYSYIGLRRRYSVSAKASLLLPSLIRIFDSVLDTSASAMLK
ncbi:hypothetical protein [uncultured Alistipes sp.]|uniref:hypothetical protein n=1 Tax=uncultured Alistipes sp. TaxID=538949 RepID=UPI0027297216|nr:hypothetical protein [uncultured Alistipes sp.]